MDSRITPLHSLTLVLPCNLDSAKGLSAAPPLLLMFYGFLLGYCAHEKSHFGQGKSTEQEQ